VGVRKKKRAENRDMKLAEEYIDRNYPGRIKWLRIRLGNLRDDLLFPGMTKEEEQLASVWKRYADAVVLDDEKLIIIEGAIFPDLGDISRLLGYEKLLRQTPEFKQYADLPVEKQLVLAVEDKFLEKLAGENDVKVVYYKPEWVEYYLMELRQRTRELRHERWERLKRRQRKEG
jgi:hypothetical protein